LRVARTSNDRADDTMTRFLIRRLLNMIPLILGITFISFLAMSLVPGNFVSNLKMNPTITPEVIHQLEAQFGLDQPLLVRYFKWLWNVLQLNLGISLQYRVSVTGLIASRAFNTIILAAASMMLSWLIAIPIGIVVAVNQNSIWDRFLSFLAFFGMSVPNFFLAFLMMYFALKMNVPWLPIGGTYSPDYASLDAMSQVADRINHLILPVFVLGIAGTAGLMRLMRSQILEIKNSEFVRTARAKGLSERIVIYKHVLRNALNPFVTMAGYSLGDLLGGAALVEAVMNLQGLGLLMLDAVRSLDIYLVMGSVLMGTILLLVGNLLADIALVAVDPRVDFTSITAE
jgi:peptide/nickel transport system permease protein